MKKIISSAILVASLSGCSSLEWRDIYNEENLHNLKITQFSENDDIEGNKSVGFSIKFNPEDYQYPYKLEKFYHVIYMLNAQSDNIIKKIHAPYTLTQKESHYKIVIEFNEKKSILDVVDYFYENTKKNFDIDLINEVEDYHWTHLNNKSNNMYKVNIDSEPKSRIMNVTITDFDKDFDSLYEY